MYVLVIPYFNILFIVSFNFYVILFHKLSCKWQHSCKRMASANDFHYAVIYCVLSVSRKHTNWLIMFVLLHFGFPSNHLSYIYVGTFNYIKYKLRENGMLSTLPLTCADTSISIGPNHCQPDWSGFTISLGCLISCWLTFIMRSGWRSGFSFSRVASVVKHIT